MCLAQLLSDWVLFVLPSRRGLYQVRPHRHRSHGDGPEGGGGARSGEGGPIGRAGAEEVGPSDLTPLPPNNAIRGRRQLDFYYKSCVFMLQRTLKSKSQCALFYMYLINACLVAV